MPFNARLCKFLLSLQQFRSIMRRMKHTQPTPEMSTPTANQQNAHRSPSSRLTARVAAVFAVSLCAAALSPASTDAHQWRHGHDYQHNPPVSVPLPTPQPTPPSITEPTPSPAPANTYPLHADITATYFWIGENASADNFGISNTSTEWDEQAGTHFGGIDDPYSRLTSGLPAAFTPLQNPYYFALPASEFNDNGLIPGAREASPWAAQASSLNDNQSLFKGRWVKITRDNGQTVYAQWIDTGPSNDGNQSTDYAYVFGNGTQKPANHAGLGAGIDLSPTIAYQFGMIATGESTVNWQFVDAANVPAGPWTQFPAINNQTYWN